MKENRRVFKDQIPEKNIEWETGEDGKIYLLKEKSGNRLMKWLINSFGKSQYFRIHLDEIGTLVWEKINGINSIRQIGDDLGKERGSDMVPQAHERVEKFIVLMLKNKFVKLVDG